MLATLERIDRAPKLGDLAVQISMQALAELDSQALRLLQMLAPVPAFRHGDVAKGTADFDQMDSHSCSCKDALSFGSQSPGPPQVSCSQSLEAGQAVEYDAMCFPPSEPADEIRGLLEERPSFLQSTLTEVHTPQVEEVTSLI